MRWTLADTNLLGPEDVRDPRRAALLTLLALASSPADARDVELGALRGSIDTTVSVGALWRVEGRDCRLVYQGHGGCNPDPFAINADDGNLNYDKGNGTSLVAKATVELELAADQVGGFLRATTFYDWIANEHDPQRTDLDRDARYTSSPINSGVVGMGFLLLDAYLYGGFELAGRPLDVRLGNQVVSWGENLFIPGGVNQINAVDVNRLRTPGSEVKEALLPAPMLWASFAPVENFGIEAYYQFYWNRTQLDPTGSYFSSNDLIGRGAQGLFLPALEGFPPAPDPTQPADPGGTGLSAKQLFDRFCAPGTGSCGIPQRGDDKPSNSGQYGVALRYYVAPIATEFGLYHVHYHSKTPSVGFTADTTDPSTGIFKSFLTGYFREYAEDVNVYGVSAATELWNVAFGAELSWRPDDPVPIEANGLAVRKTILNPGPASASGFVTEHRWQGQLNAIWTVGPATRLLGPLVSWMGADDIAVASEVAFVEYDLDHADDLATPSTIPPALQQAVQAGYAAPGTSVRFARTRVDEFSWGYQLLVQPTFTNPFGYPITVQPRLGFQHDVNGNTPGQLPFVEDRKALTLGVAVDYLNTWELDVAYTNFFGAGHANMLGDRDFVAASISYSF